MIPVQNVTYWFGVVEDINDPEQLDRVRVRVYGAHQSNKSIQDIDGTPTEHLMWMNTIMPVTSAQFSGVGQRHGLLPGSTVFGMYIDPEFQTGVVLGQTQTKNLKKDPNKGFSDPSGNYPTEQYANRSQVPQRATGDSDASEEVRKTAGGGAGTYVPDLTKPGAEDGQEMFKLADILRCEEGCKMKPYRDQLGKWTIGIGRLISEDTKMSLADACKKVQRMVGRQFNPGDSLTKQEVYDLFDEDLKKHEACIQRFPKILMAYNQVNKPRKMMLVQMCFQMGPGRLNKFQNQLQLLTAGNYRAAYENFLKSGWASQTPERAKRVAAVMYEGSLKPYIGYMQSHGYKPS